VGKARKVTVINGCSWRHTLSLFLALILPLFLCGFVRCVNDRILTISAGLSFISSRFDVVD
jgi:hypothetical protein